MDDGELDFLNQESFANIDMGDIPNSCSVDCLFDELYKDSYACTHTHICNPPGPDNSHTHTCVHVHTKILPVPGEEKVSADDMAESSEKKTKKRPSGNKEAVKKYREKQKARFASLEDEVVELRALKKQFLEMAQRQAALEAENARLKSLLVDIRGRIDGEIGSFPYNKPTKRVMNPCNNMQCDDRVYCLRPEVDGKSGKGVPMNGQGSRGCEFGQLECLVDQNLENKEFPG